MNLLFSAPIPSLTHIIKSNKSVVMETASGARRGNIFSHIFLTCLAIFSLSIVKNTILEHSRCAKEKKKKLFFASGMNSHWQWILYEICVLFAMIIIRRTSEEYSGHHTVLLRRQGNKEGDGESEGKFIDLTDLSHK